MGSSNNVPSKHYLCVDLTVAISVGINLFFYFDRSITNGNFFLCPWTGAILLALHASLLWPIHEYLYTNAVLDKNKDLKFRVIVKGVEIRPCTQTLKDHLHRVYNPLLLYVHDIH